MGFKMSWNNLRDKIQKRVEKSAWTLGGLKAYERVRIELVIWAFIFFVGVLGLFTMLLLNRQPYTFLILIALSLISFLGKSAQFKQLYMLNKIKEILGG